MYIQQGIQNDPNEIPREVVCIEPAVFSFLVHREKKGLQNTNHDIPAKRTCIVNVKQN